MKKQRRRSTVNNPQVGNNLRRLRRQKGLSIRAFCSRAKPPITPVQLLATELGKREPTLRMIRRYAEVLGVGVEALTG